MVIVSRTRIRSSVKGMADFGCYSFLFVWLPVLDLVSQGLGVSGCYLTSLVCLSMPYGTFLRLGTKKIYI